MNDPRARARNALLGLALGDALGWPAMYHRSLLLPPWTRRIRREIDAEREATGVLPVPVPFSLNQPRSTFDACPTDDTEWAAWMMQRLLAHGRGVDQRQVTEDWLALVQTGGPVRGWISTHAALDNLRRGIMPPRSGSDNPHYFDDGAMCRAVPIGISFAGHPAEASSAAAIEAAVTNSEEGIWVSSAVAAAVSVAAAGGAPPAVVEAAIAVLPPDSWPRRLAESAVRPGGRPVLAALAAVQESQSVEYSDAGIGPETLAAVLAIISSAGERFSEAVTAAAAVARGADTVPAIVGALAGALAQDDPIPAEWRAPLDGLRGICIPALAGVTYHALVQQFVEASISSREGRP
jgi:ADP-ribosylglycohydrolase